MKRSRGMLIPSIIFFLIGFCFLIVGLSLFAIKKTAVSSMREEHCTVAVTEVRRIGDSFEKHQGDEILVYEADTGYCIYELTLSVTNDGIEEQYQEAPGFYYSGEDYADVYELWITDAGFEEEPLFYYDGEPYLPAGRTTEVKEYVQVRDGVQKFDVSYYAGSSDKEESIQVVLP